MGCTDKPLAVHTVLGILCVSGACVYACVYACRLGKCVGCRVSEGKGIYGAVHSSECTVYIGNVCTLALLSPLYSPLSLSDPSVTMVTR